MFLEKEIINYSQLQLPIRINDISFCESGVCRGMHSHTAAEIIIVKSGVLNCCINDRVINVYPKQTLLINRNVPHKLFAEKTQICYIQFDTDFYDKKTDYDELAHFYEFIMQKQKKPYMLFSKNREIDEILKKIIVKYNEKSYHYLKAYLYELVAFMHAKSFISDLPPVDDETEKIGAIVRYVNNNFKEHLTLDDICSNAKYSKYALCHIFKSVTEATIFEYVNYLRIQYSLDKLRQKNYTVSEAAMESGFSSVSYFNRVFKTFMGCSPSVYRKFLREAY